MTFPLHRMRRLRATPRSRELFREARLHPSILIEPFFVVVIRSWSAPISVERVGW